MTPTNGFTDSQKSYLQGFALGADVARKVRGLPVIAGSGGGCTEAQSGAATTIQIGPQGSQAVPPATGRQRELAAQDRLLAHGKKLCNEEQAKRDKDPFSIWPQMQAAAAEGVFPKGTDVFLWKFHGLFQVAPAQDSFMCRLRIAGGELKSWQLRGVADLAEAHAGHYLDVTTRANLQLREIPADKGCAVHMGLVELGLANKGSGADNIRNVTSSATAGFDAVELIDTLPYAKAMHHHILNDRECYGLPRKFNISFDGGGRIATLEDTNDIGFQAVRISEENATNACPAGVYLRLTLGGITGHRDFARDTGILVKPNESVDVASAIVKVFVDHGDRTDRKKARLKYLLDEWGFTKFIEHVERELGRPLLHVPADRCETASPVDRWAHVGFHPQRQEDRHYCGVVLPVGRLTCDQARGLARISETYGSGRIRLTVWQNLLIPDIATADISAVQQEIENLGLEWRATSVRSGLVACTGSAGCKFAAADTKRHALLLADHLDERLELDVPVNIHFTGCHHSCAQHYIGDIGFRGTKVEVDDDMVDGYEIVVGGGYADQQAIGRQLFPQVPFSEVPRLVERLLGFYVDTREECEPFSKFISRQSIERLREVTEFNPVLVP
ncbi:MAG: ferredoxin--nitrite reductase [Planctomyces sp.]|nr:ferredoxin--nitrite reductase [Planctomyces sp.]